LEDEGIRLIIGEPVSVYPIACDPLPFYDLVFKNERSFY
jgi:hypothetical protein